MTMKPLYAPGDHVIPTNDAGEHDCHWALIGLTGIIKNVRAGPTPLTQRYRVRFDVHPGFAWIAWIREAHLIPANPTTQRQIARATIQLTLF